MPETADAIADSIAWPAADDETLVASIGEGHVPAFETLMRRYNQRLFRAARSITHNDSDAEEAVLEAWYKAYTHLPEFRAEARLPTWLTRIVINEALMIRRRNLSREKHFRPLAEHHVADGAPTTWPASANASHASPGESVWRAEIRQLLERHIQALPPPIPDRLYPEGSGRAAYRRYCGQPGIV